ncbi:MAG: hypothetical protein RIS54_1622 [Verrucomicrobiota bacterium]|jgi:protein phosphatase
MIQFRAAALTDIGRVRRRNEDRLLLDEPSLIFGVADGVGGLPGGAEAAELVLSSVGDALKANSDSMADFKGIVRAASREVHKLGQKLSPSTGIGSTLTIGQIRDRELVIGHVGDSKCYALRGGKFSCLTTDHTVENEVLARRARGEEVYFHEANRHALTRCIGQPGDVDADVVTCALNARDTFLFCTDGISGLVDEVELANFLSRDDEPDAILHEIVTLAIRRGGPDNATGVLLRIDSIA